MLPESEQSRIIWVIINYHRYYYTTSKCGGEKKPKPNKKHNTHALTYIRNRCAPSCQMTDKEAVFALNGLHILTLDNWEYHVLNWLLSQYAKYEESRSVPHKGSTPSNPCCIFSVPWWVRSHLSTSSPNTLVTKWSDHLINMEIIPHAKRNFTEERDYPLIIAWSVYIFLNLNPCDSSPCPLPQRSPELLLQPFKLCSSWHMNRFYPHLHDSSRN